MPRPLPGFRWLIPLAGILIVLLAPTPAGLSLEGQRVLAVIVLAIGLWGFETLPRRHRRRRAPRARVHPRGRGHPGSARGLRGSDRLLRLMIPNITGFLATTIPVAMSVGTAPASTRCCAGPS